MIVTGTPVTFDRIRDFAALIADPTDETSFAARRAVSRGENQRNSKTCFDTPVVLSGNIGPVTYSSPIHRIHRRSRAISQ
jgi:hypothetical protein